jgi:enoyl-CoA hydratase/carnithine racemase
MSSSSSLVKLMRHANGVAHIELNRASKLNALSVEMIGSVVEHAETIASDKSVRAVVLSGDGRAFCAGIDLSVLRDASSLSVLFKRSTSASLTAALQCNVVQSLPLALRHTIKVPVICALKGQVFGAGLQLALGADVRLAQDDDALQLSLMEARWGIIPDVAISETTRALLRPDVLLHLGWTADKVGAKEALRLGLVTRLVSSDVDAQALLYASQLVEKSNPDALRAWKRLVWEAVHPPRDAGLLLEEQLQREILASPAFKAKMAAMMTRTKPN